jgi:tetratricopeptide (TPR) repeat protein
MMDADRRRRLVGWTVGGLTLAGLAVGLGVVIAGLANRTELELIAADDALHRHDPWAARIRLDRFLAGRPNDYRGLILAAQAARRSDSCADAERFLSSFELRYDPTDASQLEWTLLGVQQGDLAGDEDRLRAAVSLKHPESAAMLEALAKGYVVAYRLPDALATVTALLDQIPDHAPGLLLRGDVLDRRRKTDEAELDYRRAVDAAPESAAAHVALAGLLSRTGRTREAIYHYQIAQRFRPADRAARLGLARAFCDAADLDEARRQLDELLAADPEDADALVERGRTALRKDRAAEAEPFLADAVRVAPWRRDAHQLLLAAVKALGRTDAIVRCEARRSELRNEDAVGGRLKLRARDAPRDATVRWELWEWSLRNGEVEDGRAWLAEILRIDSRHRQAHAALADYFERAGQPRRAEMHRADAAAS